MTQYELYVPEHNNAGYDVDYLPDVRAALQAAGHDSWTEYGTTGVWQGQREPVVVFRLLSKDPTLADDLADLLRAEMPDQDAVLVTQQHVTALFR